MVVIFKLCPGQNAVKNKIKEHGEMASMGHDGGFAHSPQGALGVCKLAFKENNAHLKPTLRGWGRGV